MEKFWIRWTQYWITYFKQTALTELSDPFIEETLKMYDVRFQGCTCLLLSYMQWDLCLHSYTEQIPLLPFTDSIDWLTSLISKNNIYYSMDVAVILSMSKCLDNFTEFLEGPGCTTSDSPTQYCSKITLHSHRNSPFPLLTILKASRNWQSKKGKAFQSH